MPSNSILGSIRHCNPDFQIWVTSIDPLDIFEEVLGLSLPLKILKNLKLHGSGEEKKIVIKDPAKTYFWKFTQQQSSVYETRQLNVPRKLLHYRRKIAQTKRKQFSKEWASCSRWCFSLYQDLHFLVDRHFILVLPTIVPQWEASSNTRELQLVFPFPSVRCIYLVSNASV